ncbi:hypothetical protein KP509_08G041400 [Ceratopteris richardii]|uniref:Protein kinase domain-containing protein n=1 Tax=Ceratopteris richardii TaxID=49495 RepID=A0A8T2UDD6_CERRI|nr:hypothetical protein KP509_08G041400 [Ceratopteris richardii]KAH7431293.1 hypothetical protein KP509_08G041400 [Ceratopteris richardii]KAH7431294.1 hypothetical protein KP509_08G041400 [Ceratopteris richardii]KAH7431296.1 hypothetical protein KP509_08G041400 [Ceratopteris richardii]KAH7431298.1 hypothetical protein KP509_08G041400 [Ceratopteris richardii]
MGCACSRPAVLYDYSPNPKDVNQSSRQTSEKYSIQAASAPHKSDISQALRGPTVAKQDRGSRRFGQEQQEDYRCNPLVRINHSSELSHPYDPSRHRERISNLPKHVHGEQVAAGWPAWLSAVAGEAIHGWVPRRADSFEKLDKIGQGTYSNVYKARDLDTRRIVALKKVRFDNLEPESVRFMAREILVLRRLDHPNVINLEGLVTSRMSCSIYLIFEYMEHDLAGLAACSGMPFTEPQIKCYVRQLFSGLEHCHTRGVLHRDIKGSNLLLDNKGILKIADFGLATFFHPKKNQALTSRVVTLWYRPPELLLGATEYGIGVDLWSSGCILAELFAGKPIMPARTEVEQLHKIFKLCGSPTEEYWKKSKLPHATIFKPQQPYKRCIAETFKDFPPSSLELLDKLLAIEPSERGTATDALQSKFFTTMPYACEPSSLPHYPPSKELDAKVRDEEIRKQRNVGARSRERDPAKYNVDHRDKAVAVPKPTVELQIDVQKQEVFNQPVLQRKDEQLSHTTEGTSPQKKLQGTMTSRYGAPSRLSSRSGPLGPRPAGPRKKKTGDDDLRMAPPRPVLRANVQSSAFTSQSGDLTHMRSIIASNRAAAAKDSRNEAISQKRPFLRDNSMEINRRTQRLDQVDKAQNIESIKVASRPSRRISETHEHRNR